MKKILIPILGITALLFFNSCSEEFLDVNKNVNDAYSNQLTPKDRLSAAETVVFRTQAGTMNRFGNLIMNAWAGNIYFYASPYGDEFRMRADSQFYDTIWDNLYLGISNYQAIIESPNAAKYPHHVAIAKIMKAYYMQMIVDLYNDVPYTEAFKGQANKHPKYDKGKDVYKGLLAELNQALVLLGQTPENATYALLPVEDPIFAAASADMSKWAQMANTVKLKMLVRLSNCTDPEVIAWRNTELQALAPLTSDVTKFVSADVKINPGYSSASTGQQNPFYTTYGVINIASNDMSADYRLTFASDHIIKALKGQIPETSGVADGRITRLFLNNGVGQASNYIGGVSGPSANANLMVGQPQGGGKDASKVETDFATLGLFSAFASPSGGSALPGLVLTLAEVRFLQAEAATVYPTTMAFNAQTSFNDGVTQSFLTFGASPTATNNYLAAISTKPGMGWAASPNKIQAIQYQKWVALTNINPTETFISYNKTGFPVLPMPLGSYYPSRPKRLMYAQSEYISNTANVPNPGIDEMYTVNQYSPFWMK
ncbi:MULTISPECIES: SusD/RagB family nutrient-binding outer membrane lipoprotein [Chryseobacterium]|uniref:SusD/RagB family nutrient-binding outer membrane lipoprotein n=1 Tax=Chryseobacterium TaxID=59732 RepID=UPI001BE5253D|nr:MULTISPECIES: SusD/RagB family nutrient-binding outer membrane lipoprotein [Chryseobacterium]MBT2620866.1 SusD/RagB family nutrient-binding outer membrane lipoprotein [Chryseobacterium sp. ISL-6]